MTVPVDCGVAYQCIFDLQWCNQ